MAKKLKTDEEVAVKDMKSATPRKKPSVNHFSEKDLQDGKRAADAQKDAIADEKAKRNLEVRRSVGRSVGRLFGRSVGGTVTKTQRISSFSRK